MTFLNNGLLGLKELSREQIEQILELALWFSQSDPKDSSDLLVGKTQLSAFFQPSTRTRLSHEAAMVQMGGSVIGFGDPKMTRAGDFYQESIKDTFRMLENYADVIVMRHFEKGAPLEASKHSKTPIINAGDGWGEHPTQVLTDLATVISRKGHLDGLNFLLVGDGRMRTMHSIGYALSRYDVSVSFVSPPELRIPKEYLDDFSERGCAIELIDDVSKALPSADVIYMEPVVQADYSTSRVERDQKVPETPEQYRVNLEKLHRLAKGDAMVLHSLPRMDELSTDVDESEYAAYWEEAAMGVQLKKALLKLILS
ncbi:aspartate carbamoyltransferase [Roseovarius sp. 2305UL8-3]|uniref:aspartate carbamoyltransferase n=1 Tax=Roseovarius conchicola TaxID=3121636 RepID=UPI003528CA7E